MKKNLYLFRHGQSIWNIERKLQGQFDSPPIPLSDQGIEDAKTVAPRLADKNIEIIFASPLMRAKQTGEIAAEALNVPIKFDDRLKETNMGKAESMTLEEAEVEYPGFIASLRTEHDNILAETGETINNVKVRVSEALTEICTKTDYHNIAIAAHMGTIGNFVQHVNNEEFIHLHNGDIVHIIFDTDSNKFEFIEVIE